MRGMIGCFPFWAFQKLLELSMRKAPSSARAQRQDDRLMSKLLWVRGNTLTLAESTCGSYVLSVSLLAFWGPCTTPFPTSIRVTNALIQVAEKKQRKLMDLGKEKEPLVYILAVFSSPSCTPPLTSLPTNTS